MATSPLPEGDSELISVSSPKVGPAEMLAVLRVLSSKQLVQGPEVKAFEGEFSAQVVGGRSVVAVNSGTSALHLGLLSRGIGPGDEVIVPSFTFAATANAVALTGAKPVFCDIDPLTFCVTPESVANATSSRTRAVMPVHMFGHPAPMLTLSSLASGRGIELYEDAAQAHLAEIEGQRVGTFGDFAAFSFYATKNMSAGEGGAVVTSSQADERFVRTMRNQGMEKRYENELVGLNNRMSDIHAAIGRAQLRRLAAWTRRRRQNAEFYLRTIEGVGLPQVAPGFKHVYHQFTLRIPEDREGFEKAMKNEHKVSCGVYYPTPVHKLKSFSGFTRGLELPETDRAAREVLSIPVHPSLSMRQLEKVAGAVNAVARSGS